MIRVLLVDDEPELLELERIFFERSGNFSVDTALTAIEAMKMLQAGSYDAIVSDYDMPEMDGIVFLKAVHFRYPDIPFIILTGKSSEDIVIEALNNGAEHYLEKGPNPKEKFTDLMYSIQHAVERRRATDALDQSEIRYSRLVDFSPDMLCIFLKEKLIYINPAGLRLLGADSLEEFYKKDFMDYVHPDYHDVVFEDLLNITDDNVGGTGYLEVKFVRPGGEVRIGDAGAVSIPYMGEGARLVMVRDITERVRAVKAYERSERKYQKLFHNSSDAIFVSDYSSENSACRIIEANNVAAELYGFEPEEFRGMGLGDLAITGGEGQGCSGEDLFESGHIRYESVHRKKDGSEFPVDVRSHIFSLDGKPVLISVVRDITEENYLRRRECEALSLIEASVGELAVLIDEIRNPLTVVLSHAEHIGGREGEIIVSQCMDIEKLVRRLDQGWVIASQMQDFINLYRPKL